MASSRSSSTAGQLKQLEHLLQEIDSHEDKESLRNVEISAAESQKQLLNDSVSALTTELTTIRDENTKLCQSIGALNQAKTTLESELRDLKSECANAKDANSSLLKQMEGCALEKVAQKDCYIQALTSRTKMMTQALSTTLATTEDESIEPEPDMDSMSVMQDPSPMAQLLKDIAAKCDSWMTTIADPSVKTYLPLDTPDEKETIGDDIVTTDILVTQVHTLTEAQTTTTEERDALQLKLQEANTTLHMMQADLDAEKMASGALKLQLDTTSARATEQQTHQESVQEMTLMHRKRLQELEDNLSQMNGYADMLEAMIGQCDTCSAKLESEQQLQSQC